MSANQYRDTDIMSDYSVLPDNRSPLERGLELAFTQLLYESENPYPSLLDPKKTRESLLPHLAQDRGVTEWDSKASLAEKRLTVETIWPIRRLAGTKSGMVRAIESLGMTYEVLPWHEQHPRGAPYSLLVIAWSGDQAVTPDINNRLDRRLFEAAAERDVISVGIGLGGEGRPSTAAASLSGDTTTVYPYRLTELVGVGQQLVAVAQYGVDETTIYPR